MPENTFQLKSIKMKVNDKLLRISLSCTWIGTEITFLFLYMISIPGVYILYLLRQVGHASNN